jgi:superfamily II DNA or RNA helicase
MIMLSLRDCQIQAINNFNKYFYIDNDGENDRGIISMCCGSGKTRNSRAKLWNLFLQKN